MKLNVNFMSQYWGTQMQLNTKFGAKYIFLLFLLLLLLFIIYEGDSNLKINIQIFKWVIFFIINA